MSIKSSLFLLLLLSISAVQSFRHFAQPKFVQVTARTRMASDSEPRTDLVPVDKTTTVNAAAVTGGFLGFVLGGPVFAVVLAAVSNYVAKNEDESGEALRGFGKVVVETYNYLNKLNSKYNLTGKASESVSKLVTSAAGDNEAIDKVTSTYNTAVSKFDELNKEYDLVTKGKEVVVAAATLSDAVIEKAVELNTKYDLVGSATKAASNVVDKTREQLNSPTKSD